MFPDPGLLSSFHVGLQYTSCPHPPWETRSSLYVAGFTWVLSPGPPDLEELEGLRRQCWCTRSSAPEACPTLWTPQLLSSWQCSQSSPGYTILLPESACLFCIPAAFCYNTAVCNIRMGAPHKGKVYSVYLTSVIVQTILFST